MNIYEIVYSETIRFKVTADSLITEAEGTYFYQGKTLVGFSPISYFFYLKNN